MRHSQKVLSLIIILLLISIAIVYSYFKHISSIYDVNPGDITDYPAQIFPSASHDTTLLAEIAVTKNNLSICSRAFTSVIGPGDTTQDLISQCYAEAAIIIRDRSTYNTDPNICENKKTENDRDNCYADLASVTGNINICENKIVDSQNLGVKDGCYYNIAINKIDPSICQNITPIGSGEWRSEIITVDGKTYPSYKNFCIQEVEEWSKLLNEVK